MSELEDLIGIYGAVDRAVQANSDLASTVAPFLGGYRDPRAIGWFDEFEAWTREVSENSEFTFPDFGSAIRNLAERPVDPTRGRTAVRRLLAIAVASRVQSSLVGGDSSIEIEAALAVDGIAGSDNRVAARALAELLRDDRVFASLEDWPSLITTAVGRGLLSNSLAVHADAPPCSGSLVEVPPGDPHPAAQLETSFTTRALTLQQAMRFLDPAEWPGCCDFWCEMTEISASPRIYREVVSLDCNNPAATWTARTFLAFALVNMPNGARVSYRLAGNPYTGPSDVIVVDEGTLTVQQVNADITVRTVKRIKFNHPFSGPSLSVIMCALGYGNVAEDLVFNCGIGQAGNSTAGSDFPETETENLAEQGDRAVPQGGGRRRKPVSPSPPLGSVLSDAVDELKRCAENCADAYAKAYDKMQSGSYTADDFVAGAAGIWSRSLRDSAKMADFAMRLVRAFGPPAPGGAGPSASKSGDATKAQQ